jgi:Tfp pilus assembly protein PilV
MMVAIVVLTVGLLGMVGTSAIVTRQATGAATLSVAANAIQSRLEWMRSLPCPQIRDSTALNRGIAEQWVPGLTAMASDRS